MVRRWHIRGTSHYVLIVTRALYTTANGAKFYCDPRLQVLFETTGIPPMEGKNICD